MSESETIEPVELPSQQVPVGELPASLRESGLINWVREPLTEAVDKRIRVVMPPAIALMGTGAARQIGALLEVADRPDAVVMMGDNPELPKMPERPILADFFRLRIFRKDVQHMLQSARIARENGMDEKVIMAALVHDIAVGGLIRADHGYWGAQLVRPYVDEEVAWAVEKHPGAALLRRRIGRLHVSGDLDSHLRVGLPCARIYSARARPGSHASLVYDRASADGQRSLFLRPECPGRVRGVRGHRRPEFPSAGRGPRIRRFTGRTHVANDDLA